MRLIAVTLLAALIATSAAAATIVETSPGTGDKLSLKVADFQRVGQKGSGLSITAGGGNPYKKRPIDPRHFGRFNPLGGSWIDSGDVDRTVWTVKHDKRFTSLNFAVIDAFDQKRDDRYGGKSYFRLKVAGATWEIAKREKNGTMHWITILFDDPVKKARIKLITRLNDGWGVAAPTVEPIPLPATAWRRLAGAGALVAATRRRPAA
jgi:hypothetical protein